MVNLQETIEFSWDYRDNSIYELYFFNEMSGKYVKIYDMRLTVNFVQRQEFRSNWILLLWTFVSIV